MLIHVGLDALSDLAMADLTTLLGAFEAISLAEYKADEGIDTVQAIRLFWKRKRVIDQLRNPTDRRRELLPFLDHPNIKVRLNAASALLALEPERAWVTMAAIRNSHHVPFSSEASLAFINVAAGIYVPD